MEHIPFLSSLLVICLSSASYGLYLITDYYMDNDFNPDFGMICGDVVEDDCAYVNSHLNTFGLTDYDAFKDCVMSMDSGAMGGSMYKLQWKTFKLQHGDCSHDYLEVYDSNMTMMNSSVNLIGRFCGHATPNTTGYPTQRYITLKYHTDGGAEDKGFRLMATRTLPCTGTDPCVDDYFHCKAENRCIDGRLYCDGTVQCDDGIDEIGCTFFEKVIGAILATGVAGIIGISGAVMFGCISIGVLICVCTCCKQTCSTCCKALCSKSSTTITNTTTTTRKRWRGVRNKVMAASMVKPRAPKPPKVVEKSPLPSESSDSEEDDERIPEKGAAIGNTTARDIELAEVEDDNWG